MKKEAGFSLVELLMVITIIAILMIVGGVTWSSYMPTYRLRAAVEELQATIQMAKLKAIKENAVTTVRFNGTDSYRAWLDDDEDGAYDAADDEIFIQKELPPQVSLLAATDAGFAQLNSRGLPNAGAMSFRLVNSKDEYLAVQMTVAGSFSIQTSETGADGTWSDQ